MSIPKLAYDSISIEIGERKEEVKLYFDQFRAKRPIVERGALAPYKYDF